MTKNTASEYSIDRWEKIWCDVVEAQDKKDAKRIVQSDNDAFVAEKVSAKTKGPVDYRIFITELTPSWEVHWLKVRNCSVCKNTYTLLQAKQMGDHSSPEFCSPTCQRFTRRETEFGDYTAGYQNHRPCIYKITNKNDGMVYIGQTTQCFTLRWYQHFFQSGEAKFHTAVKASKPTDWTFEVIEIIYEDEFKNLLNQREQYWINHYDSIEAGYNSVKVIKIESKPE